MSLATLWTVLPWLAVLACPLSMLFMMRFMGGAGCHSAPQRARSGAVDEAADRGTDEEIAVLRMRLVELEARVGADDPRPAAASVSPNGRA